MIGKLCTMAGRFCASLLIAYKQTPAQEGQRANGTVSSHGGNPP